MENKIHQYFKFAAYLIFTSIIIDLILGVIQSRQNSDFDMTTGVETSLLFMTLGYFAMIGKNWVKWVALFVTVLSTFPLLVIPNQEVTFTAPFTLQLFSGFLKITAIILLFFCPKQDHQ